MVRAQLSRPRAVAMAEAEVEQEAMTVAEAEAATAEVMVAVAEWAVQRAPAHRNEQCGGGRMPAGSCQRELVTDAERAVRRSSNPYCSGGNTPQPTVLTQ